MALPTRLSVNADVYGARALTRRRARAARRELRAAALGQSGPAWAQSISSGAGLHAKPSLRLVDDAFAALTARARRYLDVLTGDKEGTSDGNVPSNRSFSTAFHAHGPRTGAARPLFGAAWAERYSRLIFE